LQIAPSGYWRYVAQQREPVLLCARVKRDAALMPQIYRVWEQNMKVYDADKVWRQLHREKQTVARCTVERLMRRLGIEGAQSGLGCSDRDLRFLSGTPWAIMLPI
jgi:transposase InsO family protein